MGGRLPYDAAVPKVLNVLEVGDEVPGDRDAKEPQLRSSDSLRDHATVKVRPVSRSRCEDPQAGAPQCTTRKVDRSAAAPPP